MLTKLRLCTNISKSQRSSLPEETTRHLNNNIHVLLQVGEEMKFHFIFIFGNVRTVRTLQGLLLAVNEHVFSVAQT
jgi:hypothetical protein